MTEQPTNATDEPPAPPRPLHGTALTTTVLAFVISTLAMGGFVILVSDSSLDVASDLRKAVDQLVLLLVSGVAAIVAGRRLSPVARSVFIVITVIAFTASGLLTILGAVAEDALASSVFEQILGTINWLTTNFYPYVLAGTVIGLLGRTGSASEPDSQLETDAESEADSAPATTTALLTNRRRGLTAGIALIAAAIATVVDWISNSMMVEARGSVWADDVVTAAIGALEVTGALLAVRAVATRTITACTPSRSSDRPHAKLAPALCRRLPSSSLSAG
jgi:hypothetical protein